ncbi:MAG TPA: pyridoxal phosphate-dependent aminotransferase family protein, partial [Spirochaetia bacterium]|nr:pyridoxal phosphate-dependent aminotransferase family protein [Spirochaetia bacterium]
RGDHYFNQPVLEGTPGPRMKFQGREVVMWAINNYIGLCDNPEIRETAIRSVTEYGTFTPMGSRMLTGNTDKHTNLENRLAAFLGKPSSVLFNYGYLGVIGTISALVGPDDQILMDKLSHASIVDGTILASAGRRFRPYKHNDLDSLESQLKAANRDRKGGLLILTEGVFGMRGDLANLKGICELKEQYGARLLIDDAHGFGVMGDHGQGTGEFLGVQDRIDLYFGTFAKAFAAIGGVTAGETAPIEYIRYNARTNVFAKSLPMVYVDVLTKSLDLIETRPELRERMWKIARRLQTGLVELGFDIGDTASPITPVYVPAGDLTVAMNMIRMLREEYGVFVSGVTYPVVPRGIVMFRMIPTASHSEEDVDITLEAFRAMRDAMKIDPTPQPTAE